MKRAWGLALVLLSVALGVCAGPPQVYRDARPEAVASGIHVLFPHREAIERQWGVPGGADLAGHVLEQAFRRHQKELDALGCEVQCYDYPFLPFDDYYTGPDRGFIRIRVPNDRVPEALALMDQVIREAEETVDQHLKTAWRSCVMSNRMRTGLRIEADSAWRKALRERKGSPNDVPPLYFRGNLPDVAAYRKFLHAFFSPGNRIITVVGGFERQKVAAGCQKLWGVAPSVAKSSEEMEAATASPMEKEKTQAVIRVAGTRPNQAYLLLAIPLPDLKTEQQEAVARLLASYLSDRASFQLRERQGLAYSMGAGVEKQEGTWWLTVRMATGPNKLDEARQGLLSIVDRTLGAPVSSDDLVVLRNANRTRRLMKRLTSVNKAFFLGLDLAAGVHPGRASRVDAAMDTVHPQMLERLATRLRSHGRRMLILVAPDKGAASGVGVIPGH